MIFSIDGQVRYSEVDRDGEMKVEALVNYFQDCTMLHSETLGYGIQHLKETGEFWFLASWQIRILKRPRLYEKIKIFTNPYEFKGFFGSRNFWMEDQEGNCLVKANSNWVYLDLHTQTPKKIPLAEGQVYSPLEPKLEMQYEPRKIKLPEQMEALEPVPVRESQIDTNQHVNNCEYIKTAMEITGNRKLPAQIRAEYKKAAVLGDIFYPYVTTHELGCVVDLRAEDGTAYAAIEFLF